MSEPRQEHPSTYFVQDRGSVDEKARLYLQDRMLTSMMGGVLPEQADPARFQRVLDVGCGTGGWLIEAAKTFPTMKRLVGVDISTKMLDFAREQAAAQGVSDRVEFLAMDALRMLEFPADSFDLVNHRLGMSWVRTWEWSKLLGEYQRVCQSGGMVRVTEGDILSESSSSAYLRLNRLLLQAFFQAGHFFTQTATGLTSQLAPLLDQQGLLSVQTHAYALSYRAQTPEAQSFYEDGKYAFQVLVPFLKKWTRVPDDYESIYQQALSEILHPDFVATWTLLTVWGTNPDHRSSQHHRSDR